jgi:hypothetical protein
MSCGRNNIRLRNSVQDRSAPHRYSCFTESVIVPVFCVCMVSAMGDAAAAGCPSTIACDASTDTEYIISSMMAETAGRKKTWHSRIDETANPDKLSPNEGIK